MVRWYEPPPEELEQRKQVEAWMNLFHWEQHIRESIMYDNNPTIETVISLTYKYGPYVAYQKIKKFLEA